VTRRRSVVGLVAALGVVLGSAVALVFAGRWLATVPTISDDSDLSVPTLFAGEKLRYEMLEAEDAAGVPILCYHYFRPGLTPGRFLRVLGAVLLNLPTLPDKEFWTTTVPEFERQMSYLAEHGYRTLRLDELADHLDGRAQLPSRAVVITIDDGDRSFVEYAVPILRRHGFTATVFLLTGVAGESGWNDLDVVDWETLALLEEEGVVRVESHTHRMHTKVERDGKWVPRFLADAASVRLDLETSRAASRDHLGHESRFLAWPFGHSGSAVDSLAHEVGMRRVLTLRPVRNAPDPPIAHGLGRYAITARTSFRVFRLMVRP
jgi:peptidoglycan/xylan/chitin deacetylase (PgdA/CDA1 family)